MSKTALKILFILPEYYPHSGGGISTYYIHLLKSLAPVCEKIKVIVGSGYTQENNSFNIDNVEVDYLKPVIYKKYLSKFNSYEILPGFQKNIAAAWAMWEQSNEGQGYDIIECTDFGLGFIPWLTHHTKPVITRLHGSYGQVELNELGANTEFIGNFYRLTELSLLSKSDALITHSLNNKTFWQELLPGKKIELLNPIYLQEREKNLPYEEKQKFGMVSGRIQQWKGPDVLCEAFNYLKNTSISIRWYGRDTNYDSTASKSTILKNLYPKLWGETISLHPPLPHVELLEIQKKALFGIVPSTWDMFNFTCLEYLSNGTPLICSSNAGAAYLITHGVNGFVYANNSPKELALCIEKMIALSATQYKQMVMEGYHLIDQFLSPEIVIPQNLAIFSATIERHHKTSSNRYLKTVFSPSQKGSSINEILDDLPMKLVFNYLLKRIKKYMSKR
ncbi:glycosyltransferase [Pedobacter sp. Du54]|uniref:glycosyltransferase family 4 protein n=1 Tax=Pedobacter anseongensis TaxID=3133439 RepID=UPI0030B24FAA